MLRKIFGAIANALRSIGRVAGLVASAPFRVLHRILVGDIEDDVPPAPDVAPPPEEAAPAGPDMDAVYKELANIVAAWAAESIVAGQPQPQPPKFPRGPGEWLPGITIDEANTLANASEEAVSAHLRSRELIPGVRSVRALQPATWPEEPNVALDHGSSEFIISDPAAAFSF
jgi:hypothetical protein